VDLPPAGIIGGLVAFGLISFVLWSANRRRPGAPARTSALYGTAMIVIATVLVLAYLGVMIVFMLSVLAENPTATEWVGLGLGIFGLTLVAASYEVFTRKVDWDDDRLAFKSWRGEGECLWGDISSADYKPIMQYWRISFRGMKRGFALFEYMTGTRDFLEAAHRNGVPVTMNGQPIRLREP
jgi:drug/metabolite transporter (DMT)-like permease